ncbi:hypothetical protein ACFC0S_15680 [Streptomyces sp. NPDC056084]|uniref:hypothetical protein n=1 Tax=unclassified Streptomyces TaxID=2593676 RepID=UPI0035E22149
MIIAVAGETGGIGRTITALGLATAAAAAGNSSVLVDGDPYQHDAEAAARSITTLAQTLGRTPPLRVLSLNWQDTLRWARKTHTDGQVSILDLPSIHQEDILAVASAVVVPLPGDHRKALNTLFPTRFAMVAAENGAPCYALVHSVRPGHERGPTMFTVDAETAAHDHLVTFLDARVRYSMHIRKIAAGAGIWDNDWSHLAELYAPVWQELRDRLALPAT